MAIARARTGETLAFGILRRRLHIDESMACRWCCPLTHTHAAAHTAPLTPLPPPQRQPLAMERLPCPECAALMSTRRTMQSHYVCIHPTTTLPRQFWNKRRMEAPTLHLQRTARQLARDIRQEFLSTNQLPAAPEESTEPNWRLPAMPRMVCPLCDASVLGRRAIQQHYARHHPQEALPRRFWNEG